MTIVYGLCLVPGALATMGVVAVGHVLQRLERKIASNEPNSDKGKFVIEASPLSQRMRFGM